MPAGNKPKRLDRNWSWRVARRKRQQEEFLYGTPRSRKKRVKAKPKKDYFA